MLAIVALIYCLFRRRKRNHHQADARSMHSIEERPASPQPFTSHYSGVPQQSPPLMHHSYSDRNSTHFHSTPPLSSSSQSGIAGGAYAASSMNERQHSVGMQPDSYGGQDVDANDGMLPPSYANASSGMGTGSPTEASSSILASGSGSVHPAMAQPATIPSMGKGAFQGDNR